MSNSKPIKLHPYQKDMLEALKLFPRNYSALYDAMRVPRAVIGKNSTSVIAGYVNAHAQGIAIDLAMPGADQTAITYVEFLDGEIKCTPIARSDFYKSEKEEAMFEATIGTIKGVKITVSDHALHKGRDFSSWRWLSRHKQKLKRNRPEEKMVPTAYTLGGQLIVHPMLHDQIMKSMAAKSSAMLDSMLLDNL